MRIGLQAAPPGGDSPETRTCADALGTIDAPSRIRLALSLQARRAPCALVGVATATGHRCNAATLQRYIWQEKETASERRQSQCIVVGKQRRLAHLTQSRR